MALRVRTPRPAGPRRASVRTRKASRRSATTTSSQMNTFEVSKISRSSTAVCSPSKESSTGQQPGAARACARRSRGSRPPWPSTSTSLGATVDSCAMASARLGAQRREVERTGGVHGGANLSGSGCAQAVHVRRRPPAGVVEAGPDEHAVVAGRLAEHLALAVDLGQHVAPGVGHVQLDQVASAPGAGRRWRAAGRRCPRRSAPRPRTEPGWRSTSRFASGGRVGLVEAEQLGHVGRRRSRPARRARRASARSGSAAEASTTWTSRSASAATWRVERKASTSWWGSLRDEADGVGEQHGLAAGQLEPPGGGVEGGEEPVLDEHAGVGEPVEQGGLAGVRVADDGDALGPAAAWPACAGSPGGGRRRGGRPRACGCAARCAGGRPRAWSRRRRTGRAPPPRCWDSDAALAPPQAGQPVAELGQLDLGLALLAGGVLAEDVEDHRGAVDGRAAEELLEVALLGRAELVVEHDGVAVGRLGRVAQLVGLALADVGGRVRASGGAARRGRPRRRRPCRPAARARRGRPRCPPRSPGGRVTPASTMRSRKVRSMKPPDSPPYSPKAERWRIGHAVRRLTRPRRRRRGWPGRSA